MSRPISPPPPPFFRPPPPRQAGRLPPRSTPPPGPLPFVCGADSVYSMRDIDRRQGKRRRSMGQKRRTDKGAAQAAGDKRKRAAGSGQKKIDLPPDRLSAQAMEGNERAFLALVRFHS